MLQGVPLYPNWCSCECYFRCSQSRASGDCSSRRRQSQNSDGGSFRCRWGHSSDGHSFRYKWSHSSGVLTPLSADGVHVSVVAVLARCLIQRMIVDAGPFPGELLMTASGSHRWKPLLPALLAVAQPSPLALFLGNALLCSLIAVSWMFFPQGIANYFPMTSFKG